MYDDRYQYDWVFSTWHLVAVSYPLANGDTHGREAIPSRPRRQRATVRGRPAARFDGHGRRPSADHNAAQEAFYFEAYNPEEGTPAADQLQGDPQTAPGAG